MAQNWPDMSQCNFDAAEFAVAKAVREATAECINERRRSRRAGSVFMSLAPNWAELKTPLRTLSPQKQCYGYLNIIAKDMEFNRNETASTVCDQLIRSVAGVVDPRDQVGLRTASPYVNNGLRASSSG